MALAPLDRLVRAHDHVVDVGYVTVPTVAVGHVTIMDEASAAFVPVIVWVKRFMGEVTGFITGGAGAVASSVMVSDAAFTVQLPAASLNLT